MTEIERLSNALIKADRAAQSGDQEAAADARVLANELRRLQSAGVKAGPSNNGYSMSQFNAGVAESIGGLVDFINPFDKQTGSARTGMVEGMNAIGIPTATESPEGLGQNFMRGAGAASGALIPATATAKAMSYAPGITGAVSGQIGKSLATTPAAAIEPVMGGVSRMAGQATEDAGYPQFRPYAEIAAPLGVAGALAGAKPAAQFALNQGKKLPVTGPVINVGEAAFAAVAPMTQAGARRVARDELVQRAGSDERLRSMAPRLDEPNPLDLPPAQRISDEEFLALEQSARRENPELRERLDQRETAGRQTAQGEIEGMGGDVNDARRFFSQRRIEYRDALNNRVADVVRNAREVGENTMRGAPETTASARVVEALKGSLDEYLTIERRLWSSIDPTARVNPLSAKDAAQEYLSKLSDAQRFDFPPRAHELLDGTLSDIETFNGLHGLYSELRGVARNARAGTQTNKNMARIADGIADAILEDFAKGDSLPDGIGPKIADARAFSRELHEKFDQGTVGKILNRSVDGDETINPQVALSRTVGRGGADAKVAQEDILAAAPKAADDIGNYSRLKYGEALFDGDKFTPEKARKWMEGNAEFLNANPSLRREFERSTNDARFAAGFQDRAKTRLKLMDDNSLARFNRGQKSKAVEAIIKSDNPVLSARTIVNRARRDRSGAARAGVKGAFSRYLIDSSLKDEQITAKGLQNILREGEIADAAGVVYTKNEMKNLRLLMGELAKMDAAAGASASGPTIDSAPSRIVEAVAAVAGAKGGAAFANSVGGINNAGTSLQAAARGSSFATNLLDRLTNNKARQILHDAVEDSDLMRALMLNESIAEMPRWARNKLIPYLAGGALSGENSQTKEDKAPSNTLSQRLGTAFGQ